MKGLEKGHSSVIFFSKKVGWNTYHQKPEKKQWKLVKISQNHPNFVLYNWNLV